MEAMFSPAHSEEHEPSQPEPSQPGPSQPSQPGPAPPPPRSGMLNAFAHLLPAVEQEMQADRERARADTTRADEGRDWPIPLRYIKHWERVPDTLKNIPVPPNTYFRAPCMVPAQEHSEKMYSTSKCFEMLFQNDVELLADPTMGHSYWFIDECMTDLPMHIQKVLYFFDSVRTYLARDYSNYTFPCSDIALIVSLLDICAALAARLTAGFPPARPLLQQDGFRAGHQRHHARPGGAGSAEEDARCWR